MRHTKTREKVGYHLLVQEKAPEGQKGKFVREEGLFSSRQAIVDFMKNSKQFQGRKYTIVGVRINIEPIAAFTRNERDEKQGTGTHR